MTTREVLLDGGSPWGFRMHGGVDSGLPLKISRVNPGSKAALRGVREGDVISTINSQSAKSISNSDAHALLRNAGETLRLGLNEETCNSPKRRTFRNQPETKTEPSPNSSHPSTFASPSNGESTGETNSSPKGGPNAENDQLIETLTTQTTAGKLQRKRGQSRNAISVDVHLAMEGDKDAVGKREAEVLSPNSGKKCRARRARKARMVQRRKGEPVKEMNKQTKEVVKEVHIEEPSLEESIGESLDRTSDLGCDRADEDVGQVLDESKDLILMDDGHVLAGPSQDVQEVHKSSDGNLKDCLETEETVDIVGSEVKLTSSVDEICLVEKVDKVTQGEAAASKENAKGVLKENSKAEKKGGKKNRKDKQEEVLVEVDRIKKDTGESFSKDAENIVQINEVVKEVLDRNVEVVDLLEMFQASGIDEKIRDVTSDPNKSISTPEVTSSIAFEIESIGEKNVTETEVGERIESMGKYLTVEDESVDSAVTKDVVEPNESRIQDLCNPVAAFEQDLTSEKYLQINATKKESSPQDVVKPESTKQMLFDEALHSEQATRPDDEVNVSIRQEDGTKNERELENDFRMVIEKETTTQIVETIQTVEEVIKREILAKKVNLDDDLELVVRKRKTPASNFVKPTMPEVLDANKLEMVLNKNKYKTVNLKMSAYVKELDSKIACIKKIDVVDEDNKCESKTEGSSPKLVEESCAKAKVPSEGNENELPVTLCVGDSKIGEQTQEHSNEKTNQPIENRLTNSSEILIEQKSDILEPSLNKITQNGSLPSPKIDKNQVTPNESNDKTSEDCTKNVSEIFTESSFNIITQTESLASPTLVNQVQHPTKPIRKNKPSTSELTSEEMNLLDTNPSMSSQQEVTLRSFLHSLNLTEPAETQAERQASEDNIPAIDRHSTKRLSEEFYIPHQRYLEVILEENNDLIVDNDKRNEAKTKCRQDCEVQINLEERGRQRNPTFDHFKSDIKLIPVVEQCSADWSAGYEDYREKQSEELRMWVRNCRPVETSDADRDLPVDRDLRKVLAWKEAVCIMETDEIEDDSDREPTKIEMPESSGEEEVRVDFETTSRRHDGVEIVYIDSSSSGSVSGADEDIGDVGVSDKKNSDGGFSGAKKADEVVVGEKVMPKIDMSNLIRAFEEKKIGPKYENEKELLVEVLEDCNVGYVSKIKNRFEQPTSPEVKGGMLDTFNEFASMVTSGLKGTMERFSRSMTPAKVEDIKSPSELDKEFEDYVLGNGEYSLFEDDVKKPDLPKETKIETKTILEPFECRKDNLSPSLKAPLSRQQSSSSDNTSQNTIVFNNNNSPSPIDLEPVVPPKPTPADKSKAGPNSLKVLSISKVISLPYGIDILKQVGFLTKQFESEKSFHSSQKKVEPEIISETKKPVENIENVTAKLEITLTEERNLDTLTEYKTRLENQLSNNSNQIVVSDFDNDDINIDNQSVDSHLDIKSDFNSYHSDDDFDRFRISPSLTPRKSSLATTGVNAWLGTPTNAPNLLVCLSPSQRRSYHGGDVPTPEEAERLLDLHRKFSERRSHNENENKKQFQSTNQYDFVNNNPQPAGFFTTKKVFIEKRSSLPNIFSSKSSTNDSISGELYFDDPAMNQGQYETLMTYTHAEINNRDFYPECQGQTDALNEVDVQGGTEELDDEKLEKLEKQIDLLAAKNTLMEKHLVSEFYKNSESKFKSPDVTSSSGAEILGGALAAERDKSSVLDDVSERDDKSSARGEVPAGERDETNRLLAIMQSSEDEKPLNEEIHLRAVNVASSTTTTSGDTMQLGGYRTTPKQRPIGIHVTERDRVLSSPSWIENGDQDKFKDDMLSDWLSTTRSENRESVIEEEEVKKDFKETFSYWTQRERGIFDSCIGKKEERKVSSFREPDDRQKQKQAIKEEFLRSTNVKMKETREILTDRKRFSLPQEQFDKQLKEIEKNEDQAKFVSNLAPKVKTPQSPFERPRQQRQQDFHDQLQESIERRRHSYQDQQNKNLKLSDFKISKQGDIAVNQEELKSNRPKSMPVVSMPGETVRQKMYNEYMNQVAERVERRKQKVLKISAIPNSDSMSELGSPNEGSERKLSITRLENEFLDKVRERMGKLGMRRDEDDDDGGYERRLEEDLVSCSGLSEDSQFFESSLVEDYVIEGDVDMTELPPHLQEYLALTSGDVDDGIWSPGQPIESTQHQSSASSTSTPNSVLATVSKFEYQKPKECASPSSDRAGVDAKEHDVIPVVWTPRSAGASPQLERKEFRPVPFESPTLKRKNYNGTQNSEECSTPTSPPAPPPAPSSWDTAPPVIEQTSALSTSSASRQISSSLERHDASERRLTSSRSAPASGLYNLSSSSSGISLPRAQNPTITLLQKAREGQLPRGAQYLDHSQELQEDEVRIFSASKADYDSETERIRKGEPRPKIEGIGPTTKDGMPIVLRSEVKDENHGKWYKKMYDSLHRAGKDGKYPYTSAGGYQSEPDHGGGYDSDYNKYATLDRRRIKNKENDYTLPRNRSTPHPDAIKYATDIYKNQPGRIENYQPGHSSISDKETKQWWDEVLDIFDGADAEQQKALHQSQLPQIQQQHQQKYTSSQTSSKSYMSQAFKESGYASDSTLVFKRRDDHQSALSPVEHKMAYKSIQKGGEVPLHGFRKLAPERPKEPENGVNAVQRDNTTLTRNLERKESPHRYVESEVTIHYKSPVRAEAKEALSEEELARIQAEAMRRIYQEERRRKYLQELQDMNSRRHTDNFTPSQKSPISLHRYDDFFDEPPVRSKSRERTPEPKLVARALYNFQGQTSRELSFRRGDIIFVRKQIDANWYEGEHNAMIGLFPFNYVEIIPYDGIRTIPRKSTEGQARAKFNFIAQTHLEMSLVKGELVVLTRRVDNNWYEGRISTRKGIIPVSYVDVLYEPGERPVTPLTLSTSKPIASPAAHSLIINGQQQALSQHHYIPPESSTNYYNQSKTSSYSSMPRQTQSKVLAPVNQTLHIDTHSDPIPYRALYNYRPQNEDELELKEGDTVFVMEKCDDGWYVGSSQRSGHFGTFPGNYVERL